VQQIKIYISQKNGGFPAIPLPFFLVVGYGYEQMEKIVAEQRKTFEP
jgi:hypothetical protein